MNKDKLDKKQKLIDDTLLVKEINKEGKVFEKGKLLASQPDSPT